MDISTILDTSLTALAVVAGLATKLGVDANKLKYINAVTMAVSAAEKAINSVTYTDQGTLNVARENLAILVLSKILPRFNDAQARADIQKVLAVIHAHATMAAGATDLSQNVSSLVTDIKLDSPVLGQVISAAQADAPIIAASVPAVEAAVAAIATDAGTIVESFGAGNVGSKKLSKTDTSSGTSKPKSK